MRKWLIRVGVAMVASAIAFAAIVWIGSELVLRKSYAGIRGCRAGRTGRCRVGKTLGGNSGLHLVS
jgi:hypothetical protein